MAAHQPNDVVNGLVNGLAAEVMNPNPHHAKPAAERNGAAVTNNEQQPDSHAVDSPSPYPCSRDDDDDDDPSENPNLAVLSGPDPGNKSSNSNGNNDGSISRSSSSRQEKKKEILRKHNVPDTLPSLGEIRRALPSHVFESRVSTSLYYVAKDLAQVVGLFLLAEWLWSSSSWPASAVPGWLLVALAPAYWLLQGTLFWALFVLGHDAGHGSFSRYPPLNDAVGNALHGFLLCPYYCWKLSHRHHHAFTGNMDKDEVFYPIRRRDDRRATFLPAFGFGSSWFAYLLLGYHPRTVNHFNPTEPLFARHAAACSLSIGLVVAWVACLWHAGIACGPARLLVHYAAPEFVFASYLVLTTFLHHTDEHVPWYDDSVWDFVRGQLSSVDRHYGWCHDLVHNIGTHQIHHLFSTIPHYHLEEATRAFRSRFPHLVREHNETILPAFVRMFYKWIKQRVVPDSTLVHVYT